MKEPITNNNKEDALKSSVASGANGGVGKDSGENADAVDMTGIYLEIRASLTRYVSRYFKRSQEAEDVVQEAFVKVIQAQREREIQSPKSYLFRTARNLSLAQISKSSYKLTDDMGDILSDSEMLMTKSLEDQFEVRESFEIFCSAVRSLPVKCRRVFVLCRVYGFSQKEIAERLGITLGAVEAHLARGARRCIDFMEAEQAGRHHKHRANDRSHDCTNDRTNGKGL